MVETKQTNQEECMFYKKGKCMSDYKKGVPCNSASCPYWINSQDKTLDKRKPLVRSNDYSSKTEKDKTDKSQQDNSDVPFDLKPVGDNAEQPLKIKEATLTNEQPKPFCLEDYIRQAEYIYSNGTDEGLSEKYVIVVDNIKTALAEVMKDFESNITVISKKQFLIALEIHFGKSLIMPKECSDEEADYIKECEDDKA